VRDRGLLRKLSAIVGANAGHLSDAALGIAIVIHPEVPDLDAYDEGRLAERILLAAAAHGVGAAVGHFTGPDDTWAASTEAKRPGRARPSASAGDDLARVSSRARGAEPESAGPQTARAARAPGPLLIPGSRGDELRYASRNRHATRRYMWIQIVIKLAEAEPAKLR
jgi:hypothetical protein